MNPRRFPIYLLIAGMIIFSLMTFPILLQGRPLTRDETFSAIIVMLACLTMASLYVSLSLLYLLPTTSKQPNSREVKHD